MRAEAELAPSPDERRRAALDGAPVEERLAFARRLLDRGQPALARALVQASPEAVAAPAGRALVEAALLGEAQTRETLPEPTLRVRDGGSRGTFFRVLLLFAVVLAIHLGAILAPEVEVEVRVALALRELAAPTAARRAAALRRIVALRGGHVDIDLAELCREVLPPVAGATADEALETLDLLRAIDRDKLPSARWVDGIVHPDPRVRAFAAAVLAASEQPPWEVPFRRVVDACRAFPEVRATLLPRLATWAGTTQLYVLELALDPDEPLSAQAVAWVARRCPQLPRDERVRRALRLGLAASDPGTREAAARRGLELRMPDALDAWLARRRGRPLKDRRGFAVRFEGEASQIDRFREEDLRARLAIEGDPYVQKLLETALSLKRAVR